MLTPPEPRIVPDRDRRFRWYLDENITINLPEGSCMHVSKGYRFDGHSVPWVFRLFFPQYNKDDIYAALVHDALIDFESMHRYNRKYMDSVYNEYMQHYATSKWRRKLMPLAVRVNGWFNFTLRGDYRGKPKPGSVFTISVTNT